MPELLGLADGHLPHVLNAQVLADGVIYVGWFNKMILRNVLFGVILHHSGIDYLGTRHPIEIRKILIFKSSAYLDCPIAAKIEVHCRVTIPDRAYRIA